VALLLDDPAGPVDHEIQAALRALGEFLGQERVAVTVDARPRFDFAECYRLYLALLYSALSGAQSDQDIARNAAIAAAAPASDQSFAAQFARAVTMPHRDWLKIDEQRQQVRRRWAEFFTEYDLLLCPVAASPAFAHDHRPWHQREIMINGAVRPLAELSFWPGLTGVAYLPATAAPIGFTTAGLPIGVQIVGPHLADRRCIAFASLLERHYHGFVPPPDFL
jgi:amidase